MKNRIILGLMVAAMMMFLISSISALADDLGSNGSEAPWHEPPPQGNSPTWETDVDNGDGTWTFTQQVDEASTPPNYLGPWNTPSRHGFEIYSWYDGDYGWLHTFPHWNTTNLNILSATLTVHAWDIDSEPWHGWEGEYDGVHVDGTLLSPGYLQGYNNQWSTTVFDLPVSSIVDDGNINVFLNIDMHHTYDWWATTLDYSRVEVVYTTIENDPPYQPELSWEYLADIDCITGEECVIYGEGLLVEVVGPDPADPDGDDVTYTYRWFVDIGTGGFIDDEFAGRGDHTGNTVPPEDILPNDIWQVQVIPMDEHGAIGEMITVTFPPFCTVDCPFGCIDGMVTSPCDVPGVEGVDIEVYEVGTANLITSTTTDANGYYQICDLAVEDYTVTMITPAGYDAAITSVDVSVVSNDTVTVDYVLDCQGCVAGTVTSPCDPTGVVDATINAYNGNGDLIGSGMTDANGCFEICDLPFGPYTITIVPPEGYVAPVESVDITVVTNETVSADFALDCQGCVEGMVFADCPAPNTSLYGVAIDAYDSNGDLMGNAVTDANGYYQICDLPFGPYNITIVTPLGYFASAEEVSVTIITNQTVNADFALICADIVADPRTIGYWKHQVGVATGGRGHAQVDDTTLCHYLDLIENHFNNNAVNQVIIYDPPSAATCDEKLEVAKLLLNLKGNVEMIARARQQLMALLLNVAAGYIHQSDAISEDGATVSQAITYCDNLIDDPSGDHEKAKTIADLINNSQVVPANMIPLSTPNITYKDVGRDIVESPLAMESFSLSQNYPNPFNPTTSILFTLPVSENWSLNIYNVAGQRVRSFKGFSYREVSITWDGTDDFGDRVSSGVYFYNLSAGDFTATKRMVLMK